MARPELGHGRIHQRSRDEDHGILRRRPEEIGPDDRAEEIDAEAPGTARDPLADQQARQQEEERHVDDVERKEDRPEGRRHRKVGHIDKAAQCVAGDHGDDAKALGDVEPSDAPRCRRDGGGGRGRARRLDLRCEIVSNLCLPRHPSGRPHHRFATLLWQRLSFDHLFLGKLCHVKKLDAGPAVKWPHRRFLGRRGDGLAERP